VTSTFDDKEVEACMIKAVATWKFPARPGAKITTVVFPIAVK
jgi:hypothetical protein